ncbi:MAG: SAP domain-containing protein [Deltaproteobacteria bacterium]|nr:SAP domain-containing protein [Deltaproteobacteria bacterium]
MNLADIKQLAKDRGINPGRLRKAELIRTLQTQEGNLACFNTGVSRSCEQPYCLWHDDCR